MGGLLAIAATKLVEKERKRKRKAPAHIASSSRIYSAEQGAKTDEKNRNFFHGAHRFTIVWHNADKKGRTVTTRFQLGPMTNNRFQMTDWICLVPR